MNDALFAVDHHGKIIGVNAAAETLTRLSRQELIDQDLEKFIIFDLPSESRVTGGQTLSPHSRDSFAEEHVMSQDGKALLVSSSTLKRKSVQTSIRVCLVQKDITSQEIRSRARRRARQGIGCSKAKIRISGQRVS